MCETAPNRIFAHVHPDSGEELRIMLNDEGALIAEYKNDGRRIDGADPSGRFTRSAR